VRCTVVVVVAFMRKTLHSARPRCNHSKVISLLLDDFFVGKASRQYSPVSVCAEMELKRKRLCAPVRNSSLRTHQYSQPSSLLNTIFLQSSFDTHKLNVIYPSRSESYFLNTSVILFKLMHACTNRSKLSTFCLSCSSPRPRE